MLTINGMHARASTKHTVAGVASHRVLAINIAALTLERCGIYGKRLARYAARHHLPRLSVGYRCAFCRHVHHSVSIGLLQAVVGLKLEQDKHPQGRDRTSILTSARLHGDVAVGRVPCDAAKIAANAYAIHASPCGVGGAVLQITHVCVPGRIE